MLFCASPLGFLPKKLNPKALINIKSMKYIQYLFFMGIGVMSCTSDKSAKNTADSTVESTSVNVEQVNVEMGVSYQKLKLLIEDKQPIPKAYLLTDPEILVSGGALYEHIILQKSDDYIIIKSRDGGTDISKYYLLSFSTKTGNLISFIELGQETEGVDPYKLNWQSNTSFSTVDYQYELLEDEESGAYIKGNLLDSMVQNYEVNASGLITPRE